MPDIENGVLELEVVGLRRESDCVLSIELADSERRRLPPWNPGAHIDLGLPEQVRQYSLIGDPTHHDRYRLAVLREPLSAGGSHYVHDELRPGELVEVGGPRNHFPLVHADRYILLAGGIGVTPLLSMAAALEKEGKGWQLHYGGRSRRSMAFLSDLARYGDKVQIRPFDEDGDLDLDTILGEPADDVAIYCCGPSGLLEAVERKCAGWPRGALHIERFSARVLDDDEELRPFDLILDRSSVRIPVPLNTSALDALEAAGVDVPNACRSGVCGSCEIRVLAGEPQHRDSLTTPDSTDVFMPCVSRAHSNELRVDL
ncbi:PDR/VanB family oxidoreductase [Rhodococcus wratislaviensis]|uniref:Putative oxidoreductase n=1 Tax=Rhodococcus wratislaviensis NBRC 100605 TaxID=1219028 RepID=X0QBI5_RHOWR|nr:PDR/VanB family oxidoreductase [Rhodococcus wratislaviensis]GAF48301.1 putative oxidoreductase [Rhodococcus wratislaviensis NBRC 100605]